MTGKKALGHDVSGFYLYVPMQMGTYHVAYVPDEETLELAYCRVIESFDVTQSKTAEEEPQPALAAKSRYRCVGRTAL